MARARLNTEKVVALAAEVADEVGWEALSLAAVANRAGVKLPSLYKHVASVDALRLEISVLALQELATSLTRAVLGKSGTAAVRALADAYRDYGRAHPGRYAATLSAPTGDHAGHQQAAADVLRVVQAALEGYGLSGDDQTDATRALRSALHGFVHLENNGGFGLPADVDRSYRRLVDGLDQALSGWATTEAQ